MKYANAAQVIKDVLSFFGLLIVLASLFLFLWAICPSEGMTQGNYYPSPSPSQLAKAHAFHGISASYRNLDGVWVFERNGEWCKLFKEKKSGNQVN